MLAKYPNYRIICLDKLTYAGNLATLQPVMDKPGFRFVQADICDREAVNRLFEEEKPDIVVNFAAESHVDRSIENPGIFLQTNIMGTAVLMDACRKYGIRRYHQISTDEVYGDLTLAEDADRSCTAKSKFNLQQLQGERRPAGNGLPQNIWPACDDISLQQ